MKTTRNQQFAAIAFEQISTLSQEANKEKYSGMAKQLPFLVRSAGLIHALEFVATRKEKEFSTLLDHLAKNLGEKDGATLRARVRKAELGEYMRMTRDVLVALQWYKRFVDSVLKVED